MAGSAATWQSHKPFPLFRGAEKLGKLLISNQSFLYALKPSATSSKSIMKSSMAD